MGLRAVAILVSFMLVVAGTVYVTLLNQATLTLRLRFFETREIPVYALIAWSFLAGFGLTSVLVVLRSSRLAFDRWREARRERARARTERLFALGLQALLGGNLERAESRFREVLAKDPEHAETLIAHGDLLRGMGRAREAADLHRRAADLRPGDLRPLMGLASDWNADGNLDKAREALLMIIEANPRASLRARMELRDLLMRTGRWPEALKAHEAVESAFKAGPEQERERRIGLGLRYEIARAEQASGDLRAAVRSLRAIVRIDPTFVPAALALGDALIAHGEAEDGVRAWCDGFGATESPLFLERVEEHYLKREQPEELLELMRRISEGAKTRVVAAFQLAKLYLRLEMIDEAERVLSSVQGLGADLPSLRYFRARILTRRGRLKDALDAYRAVIQAAGTVEPVLRCRSCRTRYQDLVARCPSCGDWGTVDVDTAELKAAEAAQASLVPRWMAGA